MVTEPKEITTREEWIKKQLDRAPARDPAWVRRALILHRR